MAKTLILFIQSPNPDTYVNVLTHCTIKEEVSEIYFAANKEIPGKQSEVQKIIQAIRTKLETLSQQQLIYKQVLDLMPAVTVLDTRIIRTSFIQPEDVLPSIKKKFTELNDLLVDISGCNKRLASDIIAAYIPNRIVHVCCFELEDEVFTEAWRKKGKSRLYHDLKDSGVNYYVYVDFSRPGTTINSFNRMRLQGNVIRILFLVTIILSILTLTFLQQQKSDWASVATVMLVIVTAIGFFNDTYGLFDRLK